MKAWIVLALMCVVGSAWGQTTRPVDTRPTTGPVGPDLAALRLDVLRAEQALTRARNAAKANAEATPAYRAAAVALAADERALAEARASGAAQQKLDASAAAAKTRAKMNKIRDDAVAGDAVIKEAEAKLAAARAALAKGEVDAMKFAADQVAAAEAERMKDPIYRATKEGRLVNGMTLEQAEKAMKRKGVLVNEDSGGTTRYRWPGATKFSDSPRPIEIGRDPDTYAEFRQGKIVQWERTR